MSVAMSRATARSEDARAAALEDARRPRLPAWRDVRRAVSEGSKLNEVYAVEVRPGGVVRFVLKHEASRSVEQPPPAKSQAGEASPAKQRATKENARQRKIEPRAEGCFP